MFISLADGRLVALHEIDEDIVRDYNKAVEQAKSRVITSMQWWEKATGLLEAVFKVANGMPKWD